MSNPTTPFSWQMPTATDLVTDLPADFEVFGQAVATSMQYLLGGTTGQILSKTSATDMAFTWIANDQGDITGVTATTPLTGGGSSGAITVGIQDALTTQKGAVQLSDSTSTTSSILAATPTAVKSAFDTATTANTTANAAIPKSTVTTNGDVIYATGSSAVTRLGIGSAGQVLTVAAGVPSWAAASSGGMTLLNGSGTTLSGASTSISITTTGYTALKIYLKGVYASASDAVFMRINADSGTNYSFNAYRASAGGATGSTFNESYSSIFYVFNSLPLTNITKLNGNAEMDIWFPTSTDHVNCAWSSMGGPTGSMWLTSGFGVYDSSAAITALSFHINSGTFSGGTAYIYGVK